MIQDGIRKLLEGVTALSELERVIELPYQLASIPTEKQVTTNEPQLTEKSDEDFQSHIV